MRVNEIWFCTVTYNLKVILLHHKILWLNLRNIYMASGLGYGPRWEIFVEIQGPVTQLKQVMTNTVVTHVGRMPYRCSKSMIP